jgi:peroxiredoxin
MTAESVIADGVAEMHAALAKEPPNEAMGAFSREQAAYQQHLLPALAERGVRLVAISPQAPYGSLSMQEKHDLAFTVLTDPGNGIAHTLGILTQPSGDVRAEQLELGLDLTAVNADGTTGMPMPTMAILDAGHVLRWIDVHPDYTTRTEPAQVLDALDRLGL